MTMNQPVSYVSIAALVGLASMLYYKTVSKREAAAQRRRDAAAAAAAQYADTVSALARANLRTLDKYSYGTAGFRCAAKELDSVMLRMGMLAALRSRACGGRTVGVMVTASHNPERDNGVKLVDPNGDMMDMAWEGVAARLANADAADVWSVLADIVEEKRVSWSVTPSVFVGRDTRASSPALCALVVDGVRSVGGEFHDYGVVTTPQLHYMVDLHNYGAAAAAAAAADVAAVSGGGGASSGCPFLAKKKKGVAKATTTTTTTSTPPTLQTYYDTLSAAFLELTDTDSNGAAVAAPLPTVTVDCANGVGAVSLREMATRISHRLPIKLVNDGSDAADADAKLNHLCGAEHVQKSLSLPRNVTPTAAASAGAKFASVDGDADRLVYYFADASSSSSSPQLQLLDGDKIIVLFTQYLASLITTARLSSSLSVGIVQTAYANGASTDFMTTSLRVTTQCASTGVKYVHHKAAQYDVGVYFEANGHGTVLFSARARSLFRRTSLNTALAAEQRAAGRKLLLCTQLLNQCVGDAVSDMLFCEVVLQQLHSATGNVAGLASWAGLYADLPSRMLKVQVPDRTAVVTSDAERHCDAPAGLQAAIDAVVAVDNADGRRRAFVRPSGTEDVVRVYAEASTRAQADALADDVCKLVSQFCDK